MLEWKCIPKGAGGGKDRTPLLNRFLLTRSLALLPVTRPQCVTTKWKPFHIWLQLSCESLHSAQHRAHFTADTAYCHCWITLTFTKSFSRGSSACICLLDTAHMCLFEAYQQWVKLKRCPLWLIRGDSPQPVERCGLNWTISIDLHWYCQALPFGWPIERRETAGIQTCGPFTCGSVQQLIHYALMFFWDGNQQLGWNTNVALQCVTHRADDCWSTVKKQSTG